MKNLYIVFDNDSPEEAYFSEKEAERVVDVHRLAQRERAKEIFPRMEARHYWHVCEVELKDWLLRELAASGSSPWVKGGS